MVRCEHRLSARQSMEQYLTCMEDFSWLDTIKCAAVYVLTCLILRTNLQGRALLLPVLQVRRPALLLFSHSVVSDSATPWTAAHQASLSFTISQSLLKLMSIESAMPSNHLILRHPLLFLPSTFPSIRVFSNESALCIRWPKYWSFSLSISPSNEYLGLISFRMDWLDLLAVQGTLKRILQHI